ncbi:3', 5'-cyclic nucleotide phosphodiesterase domain-containing protein [Cryptosporidium serpentis]
MARNNGNMTVEFMENLGSAEEGGSNWEEKLESCNNLTNNKCIKDRLKDLITPIISTMKPSMTNEFLYPFSLTFRSEILERNFLTGLRKRMETGVFWIGILALILTVIDIILEVYHLQISGATRRSSTVYFAVAGTVVGFALLLIASYFMNFLTRNIELLFTFTSIIVTILNIISSNLLVEVNPEVEKNYDPTVQHSRSLVVITFICMLHFLLPTSFLPILFYVTFSIGSYIILVPSILQPMPNEPVYISTIIYLIIFSLICVIAKRLNVISAKKDFYNMNLIKAEIQILEKSINQAPKSTVIEGTLAKINKVQLFLRYLNTTRVKGINKKMLHETMSELTAAQVNLSRTEDIYAVDPASIFMPAQSQVNIASSTFSLKNKLTLGKSLSSKPYVMGVSESRTIRSGNLLSPVTARSETNLQDSISIPINSQTPQGANGLLSPRNFNNDNNITPDNLRRNTESRMGSGVIPGPSRRRLSMMIAGVGENSSSLIDPSAERVREYITAEFTKSSVSRREGIYSSRIFGDREPGLVRELDITSCISDKSPKSNLIEENIIKDTLQKCLSPRDIKISSESSPNKWRMALKEKRKIAQYTTMATAKLLSLRDSSGTVKNICSKLFNGVRNAYDFILPEKPSGVEDTLYEDIEKALQLMESQYGSDWDLNMWNLKALTYGNCLTVAGLFMIFVIIAEERNLLFRNDTSTLPRGIAAAHPSSITAPSKLIKDISKFAVFIREVNIRYLNNKYHNELHGANVCHHTVCLTKATGLWNHLDTVERLAIVIAALGHDVGHVGRTSSFLVNSRHMLAINYNDRSVLEMFHASLTFRIIYYYDGGAADFIQNWDADVHKDFRRMVIEFILETDMHRHFECVSRFRVRRQASDWDPYGDVQDRLMLARTCLKAADIGHGALEWAQHYKWCRAVVEEFFIQGDEEKALALPISPICDRESTDVPKSQVGFLNFVCLPLFQELCYADVDGGVRKCIDRILENINYWEDMAEAEIQWDSDEAVSLSPNSRNV